MSTDSQYASLIEAIEDLRSKIETPEQTGFQKFMDQLWKWGVGAVTVSVVWIYTSVDSNRLTIRDLKNEQKLLAKDIELVSTKDAYLELSAKLENQEERITQLRIDIGALKKQLQAN